MNQVVQDNEVTITILQGRLNDRGESLKPDGWGGDKTRAAMDRHLPPLQVPQRSPIEEFQALLDRERIRHFSAREVFYRGGSDGRLQLNSDPPRELWPNIIPTLRVLDDIRDERGGLMLTSIFRNVAYNKAIGGETNSFHTKFQACDVIPLSVSVQKLWEVAKSMRDAGRFKGGIGKYASFVHIDTRGYNADW